MKRVSLISAGVLLLLLGVVALACARQDQHGQDSQTPKRDQQAKRQEQAGKQEQQQRPSGQQDQESRANNQQAGSAKPANANNQQQHQQASAEQDQQNRQRSQNASQQREARSVNQERQANANNQPQQRSERQQTQQQHQQQGAKPAQQRSPVQERQQQAAWQADRAHNWQSEHRTWRQRGGYVGYRVPDARFHERYGQDHAFIMYSLPVMVVGGDRRFQYGGYWFGLVDPWPEYWATDWYDSQDVYVDYYGDGYYLYNRRYPGDRIAIRFYLN